MAAPHDVRVPQLMLLLIAGLALRALIAWIWIPESGFFLDLELNADWVRILVDGGWHAFYRAGADYFIDYPPVYFVVLSAVGWLNEIWTGVAGGPDIVVALLKLPPILFDVATAAMLAPLAARVAGPSAAVPAAAVFLFNPAVIIDSSLYGQNDSAGAFVVVAALLCLVRGWTELASALAVVATLVKFQFGFIIPVVLIAGLRRHGLGSDRWRIATSLASAFAALAMVAAPFGLSLFDGSAPERSLWHRFAAASEAFPGVTQNAFNVWMTPFLDVLHLEGAGTTAGRIVDDGRVILSLGPVGVTWQLVGGLLFLGACLPAFWLLWRRSSPAAVVLAAFCIAVALYMFPTRIHERYLVPALAVGVPLLWTGRFEWRVVYVVLSAVAFFAIYFVYTLPNLNRHLPRDPFLSTTVLSPLGIYLLSAAGVAATVWIVWRVIQEGRHSDLEHGDSHAAGGTEVPQRPPVAGRRERWLNRRRATWISLIVVSALAAFVSARVTFGAAGWLWNLDLPKVHYPFAAFFHEALAEGHLPLWNDRLGLGYPLYAEGQIGAFYPPNWLIFRLEPLLAMDVSRLVHLTLAGVGTGLLGLRMSGSRAGALVAALVAVLGGAIVTKLEWWNLVAAYGWMPWVLLPLARRGAPGPHAVVVAGVLWGVQALTGHPNTWLLTGAAAVVLLLRRPIVPAMGRVAWFGALGVAVGAVQLIPTLLLQRISVRSLGLSADDLFTSAATPFDVLGLGFANAFVRATGDGAWDFPTAWYPDGIFALLEASLYVGLPAVGLAALGMAPGRARRWVVLGSVMVGVAAVAAFRPEWWQAVPLLNGLRSPVRSYLVVTVVIAVLAAIGMSRLGRERSRGALAVMAMSAVVAAYLVVTISARSMPALFDLLLSWSMTGVDAARAAAVREQALPALLSLWPLALELAAAVGMGLIALRRRDRTSIALAALVTAVPLVLLSPAANPVRDRAAQAYGTTEFVATVATQDAHRVLVLDPPGYWEGMPDQLAAAGVPDVDMFSSLNLLAGDQLVRSLREADPDGDLRRAVGIDLVVRMDGSCPGRPVAEVTAPRAEVCRVDDRLRVPYWIPEDAVTSLGSDGRVPVAEVDVDAVLVSAVPMPLGIEGPMRAANEISAPADGWIYLDRSWWHGWQTTVDGVATEARAALGGQLVPVTEGNHTLVTVLVPWDAGMGLAFGAVAALASAAILGRRGLSRTTGSSSPTSPRR